MKKLLITGFEPFGGEVINPSWDAVCRLPDVIGDYELVKLLIPVVFGDSAKIVIEEARRISPDAILCIGQAGGRDAITPEMAVITNMNVAEVNKDWQAYQPYFAGDGIVVLETDGNVWYTWQLPNWIDAEMGT